MSLVVPFIAYNVCRHFSTGHLLLLNDPHPGVSVALIQLSTFLVSTFIGVALFLMNLRLKQWRLACLPLLSLIITYLCITRADMVVGVYQ